MAVEVSTSQHNLPIQLTSFVDRVREMAEVEGLLASVRLVTLTGTGGAGKTRLALQIAARLLERFSHGVWLVELAPVAEPGLVAHAIAAVVAVQEQADRPVLATLRDYLRDRQLLLLLDNCEHLVDACAETANGLLRSCPNVRILATSREALGVAGEIVWRVPSLRVPDRQPLSDAASLSDYAAARLFLDRAAAASPGFEVTRANATALAQICRRLDGVPLAIELAAAWVKALSLEQIASRLDDRFRLLVGGGRTTVARQRTLRGALDWSYDLLSPEERRLFGRLSVFAGSWTLEAAEGICSGDDIKVEHVLDLVGHLIDKSLVTAHETQDVLRYGLLETLREYAAEKLHVAGETERVRERHAGWYLGLAERLEPQLIGFEQRAALESLEHEHDNLRAGLRWFLDRSNADGALRYVGALWRFWEAHAHLGEGRRLLNEALALSPTSPVNLQAKALTGAGLLASRQGDFVEAVHLLEESLRLYTQIDDPHGQAYALTYLAVQAQEQGQTQQAAVLHQQSLALYEELADRYGLARTLNNLGYHLLLQGEFAQAAPNLERSLALGRELGDGRLIAVVLYNLGWVAQVEADRRRAQALYEEALALFRQAGDRRWIAFALQELGGLAQHNTDLQRAVALTTESLALFRDVGEKAGVALCLERLAKMAIAIGDAERAGFLFGAAEFLRERQNYPLHAAEIREYQTWIERGSHQIPQSAWTSTWQSGRTASLEQAIESALSLSVNEAVDSPSIASPLTPREQEVARLVVRGLTNRQIAHLLVVSERTVDAHIDHIRDKLGVRSRAGIAGWAAANGLV